MQAKLYTHIYYFFFFFAFAKRLGYIYSLLFRLTFLEDYTDNYTNKNVCHVKAAFPKGI